MNKWLILASIAFIVAVGVFCERFGENRVQVKCDQLDQAQIQNTVNAEHHVIGQMQTQNQISQEEQHAYLSTIGGIDALYDANGLPAASRSTGTGLRPLPSAACGIQTSKKYKLTPEQCDQEEAKCTSFWNWAQKQALIK